MIWPHAKCHRWVLCQIWMLGAETVMKGPVLIKAHENYMCAIEFCRGKQVEEIIKEYEKIDIYIHGLCIVRDWSKRITLRNYAAGLRHVLDVLSACYGQPFLAGLPTIEGALKARTILGIHWGKK